MKKIKKKLSFFSSIFLGKLLLFLTRTLKRGGGTAAPGLIARRMNPNLLSTLISQLPKGSVVVSGTNGKTTTSRIITTLLQPKQLKILHNRTGSNLLRGIASTCIEHATLAGTLSYDLGVWEIDEFVLPHALEIIKPKVVVITNLFRDQLDRYGEIDTIKKRWLTALKKLPKDTTVILNADDPSLAFIGSRLNTHVIYFGLTDQEATLDTLPHAADCTHCPDCHHPLDFDLVFSSHMGEYHCRSCSFRRPEIDLRCTHISEMSIEGTQFEIEYKGEKEETSLRIPGIYNVYNALAAVSTVLLFHLTLHEAGTQLSLFSAAFGRVEKLTINGKTIYLFLVKNPTGFNEVLRTLLVLTKKRIPHLYIAINDLIADGRDVSWLWDVDFEVLKGCVSHITVSGIRAADMFLRLKYAQVLDHTASQSVSSNQKESFEKALRKLKGDDVLFVLPTYTAMLEIRDYFAKKGYTHRVWKD